MVKLSAEDYYLANDALFMDAFPERRQALIENLAAYPPKMCVECLCFKWVFGPDNRICGGQCSINTDIHLSEFKYGTVAEGCPIRRNNVQQEEEKDPGYREED